VERFGEAAHASSADRDAERLIRGVLAQERPHDALMGRESTSELGESGRRWIIAALDGTVSYVCGYPHWCVSVALEDRGGTAAGVVYDPNRDELFMAERGVSATLDGKAIRVDEAPPLAEALVATGFGTDPDWRARQAEVVRRVLPAVRDIRRAGAAALDLAWLAAGRLDAYYERGLHAWAWAAGGLLVREAAGAVEELEGHPVDAPRGLGDPLGLIAGPQATVNELRPLVDG
jgi:fructose-1,6-bisphosphatase/inositol monophosphatase family enzyme